jgi:hypothetical protein
VDVEPITASPDVDIAKALNEMREPITGLLYTDARTKSFAFSPSTTFPRRIPIGSPVACASDSRSPDGVSFDKRGGIRFIFRRLFAPYPVLIYLLNVQSGLPESQSDLFAWSSVISI